ncbi:MAG: ATP-dependent DNA helicase RecG [Deltaproteobacteria bacterium]
MGTLEDILDRIEKPLLFASKNSFSHLPNIKGLESTIQKIAVGSRQSAAISADKREKLERIAEGLKGFDLMPFEDKKKGVINAIAILRELRQNTVSQPLNLSTSALSPTTFDFLASRKALSTPMQFIKGVGPKLAALLEKKGIRTVEDALYFIPREYQDRREIKKISKIEVGRVETITGDGLAVDVVGFKGGRKKVFEIMVGDGSGIIIGKWFHFNMRFVKGRFKKGERVVMTGEVRAFGGQREMHHPDVEPFDSTDKLNSGRIVPVYPLTEGLGEKTLRKIISQVIAGYLDNVIDALSQEIVRGKGLMPLKEALEKVHFPDNTENITALSEGKSAARRRLVFDEFFFLELGMALRHKGVALEKGLPMEDKGELTERLKRLLPFNLTLAQERVISEIKRDMASPHPMNRLVQGDVGCGKTIVAFISVLIAVENGHQAVIMAPTELLAEQHYLNMHRFADLLGLKIALLTSSIKGKEREAMLFGIRTGAVQITIGTHAVIQESVEFSSLGLAIIDEQHRFGVVQRGAIKRKGNNPHILVMTATPIPRTLAMTVYGDLDLSVIDEMPPGRNPVETRIFNERDREKVYAVIKREIAAGRQAYIVYPLVEESEKSDLMDATNMAEKLKDNFPEFRVGLLHGRMKAEEKEAVMKGFKEREVDVLVATTVIEVGIDVPNATVMVIEHAERFGLSQLHQLRGRVGRDIHKSYCLLLAQYKRSEDAWKRLRVMEETLDGFRIAEADLEIRGPGDFLGTRQSGMPDLRVGNIIRDARILEEAKTEAFRLVEHDPYLSRPENGILKEVLKEKWQGRLELAGIG